jgi:hypothetical protein
MFRRMSQHSAVSSRQKISLAYIVFSSARFGLNASPNLQHRALEEHRSGYSEAPLAVQVHIPPLLRPVAIKSPFNLAG